MSYRIKEKASETKNKFTFKEVTTDQNLLIFSFKHIFVKKGELCFNNPVIQHADYVEMIEFIQFISNKTRKELQEDADYFHFHSIDLRFKPELKYIINKNFKLFESVEIPEIISFRAIPCDDEKRGIAPRYIGYFTENILNLMFLDFQHVIYPSSNCRATNNWKKIYE